ncbi:MAG: hypothetical protein JWN86_945 [Planctomycetota bacterium]|nr:hypothetical protein [Planctomycetota bacterium]
MRSYPRLERTASSARRRPRFVPGAENLEARQLMAVGIDEIAVRGKNPHIADVAVATDGSVWFTTNYNTDYLDKDGTPTGVWRIGADGAPSLVPNQPALTEPSSLAAGPDGSMWVASYGSNGAAFTEFTANWNRTASLDVYPQSYCVGPDGNLWMTVNGPYQDVGGAYGHAPGTILRYNPSTNQATSFHVSSTSLGSITPGPDGNLWFADESGNKVDKITTAGAVTEYGVGITPSSITAATGGALWFTASGKDANGVAQGEIGRITTDGALTTYPLGSNRNSLSGIAPGSSVDSIWFSDANSAVLGHVFKDGDILYLPLPTANAYPYSLVADGKGGFVFDDLNASAIGHVRFDLPEPGVNVTPLSFSIVDGNVPNGLDVARFTTTDWTATASDFRARVDYGNAYSYNGSIVADGQGAFIVRPQGYDSVTVGQRAFVVTVFDTKHHNSVGTTSTSLSVVTVGDAPLTATGRDLVITANMPWAGVVADLYDPGIEDDSNFGNTRINWGDGSAPTTATIGVAYRDYNGVSHNYTISGTHTYAQTGSYTVTVTAADTTTSSVATSKTNVYGPLVLSPTAFSFAQGQRMRVKVATFTDPSAVPGNNQARVSCTLPNNNGPVDLLTEVVGNDIWATGTFNNPGAVPFQISVNRFGDTKIQAVTTAQVTAAPVTATASMIAPTAGVDLSQTVATFTSSPGSIPIGAFAASVDWGDGTKSDGTVKADSHGGYVVIADHVFQQAGTSKMTVTIDNIALDGSRSVVATSTATATIATHDLVLVPVLDVGFAQGVESKVRVASFTDDPNVASIPYHAQVSYSAYPSFRTINLPTQLVLNASGGHDVYAVGKFPDWGTATIAVEVNRIGGSEIFTQTSALVTPYAITATALPITTTASTTFSGTIASFTSVAPFVGPGSFSATVDWGDGTKSDAKVQPGKQGGFDVIGDHVFHQGGTPKVTITINNLHANGDSNIAAQLITNATVVSHDVALVAVRDIGLSQGVKSRIRVASFTDDPILATTTYQARVTATLPSSSGPVDLLTELVANGSGGIDVFATGTFNDWGTVPFQIYVARSGESFHETDTTALVTPASVTATARPITTIVGASFFGTIASFPYAFYGNTYYATVDWGDGTKSDARVTLAAQGLDVVGDHVFHQGGTPKVTITINNVHENGEHNVAAQLITNATVASHDVALVAVQDIGFSQGAKSRVRVASFTDEPILATTTYQARVTCTLPSSSSPVDLLTELVANGSGGIDVFATGTFNDWGTVPLQVYVNRAGGAVVEADTSALVTPAPITATAHPISSAVGMDYWVWIASFSSSFPFSPGSFAASVNWGDGTNTAAQPSSDGEGGFNVYADHIFGHAGIFHPIVTIENLGQGGERNVAAKLTTTATVAEHLLVLNGTLISATANQPFSGLLATLLEPNAQTSASDFVATIQWGDGTPDTPGTIQPAGAGGYYIEGVHEFAFGGHGTVRVTVSTTNGSAPPVVATTSVTVADAPFDPMGVDLKGTAGAVTSGVVATFYDPTASPVNQYTASINWGDGSTSPGVVSSYNNGHVVFGSHTYALAGPYQASVTIREGTAPPVKVNLSISVADKPVVGTPSGSGPVGPTGPGVTPSKLVSIKKVRDKRGVIRLVLTYSGAMDLTATDLGRYAVTDPGKDKKFGTKDDHVVRIGSAKLDAKAHTVTLSPKGTFSRSSAYRVAVKGGDTMLVTPTIGK